MPRCRERHLPFSSSTSRPHLLMTGRGEWNEEVREGWLMMAYRPDVDDVIGPDGETFGAFTKRIIERHYQSAKPDEAES